MIKSSELRINNILNYGSGDAKDYATLVVKTIGDDGINHKTTYEHPDDCKGDSGYTVFYEYEYLHGIPLNPELLEKYGFEQREEIVWDLVHNYRNIRIVLHKNSKTFTFPYHTNGLITLKFLHQLQNLILALTGKELEIKELV